MAITIEYKPYNQEEIFELLAAIDKYVPPLNKIQGMGITTFLDENNLAHVYGIRYSLEDKYKTLRAFNATYRGRPLLFDTMQRAQVVLDKLREKRKEQIAAIKKMKKKVGVK
jgi:histone acetyltransferase (RNA polymerase elongator complex component)